MTAKTDIPAFLSRTPPFSAAAPSERAALAASASARTFARHETIFDEGEPEAAAWLVRSGRVRIMSASAARSLPVESLGPGELFGVLCRLGAGVERYLCTAVAETPVTALRLPDAAFLSLYRRSAGFARATCGLCARRLGVMRLLAGHGRRGAGARLAEALLGLRREFGDRVPATRELLARRLGTAQETVFRLLARWRRRGALSTGRGVIVIHDAAVLEAAAAERP